MCRESRRLRAALFAVGVFVPPVLIAMALCGLNPRPAKEIQNSFNIALLVCCSVIAVVGFSFAAMHFAWIPECLFSVENWVDDASALTLLFGSSWMALGVILSKRPSSAANSNIEGITSAEISELFRLASLFAKQGIVFLVFGAALIIAKPVVVKWQKNRNSVSLRSCPQEESPLPARQLGPKSIEVE